MVEKMAVFERKILEATVGDVPPVHFHGRKGKISVFQSWFDSDLMPLAFFIDKLLF